MPLVSVIVPIYKVEAYLERCIESIVNQTYSQLEIILVDDGSPDGCPALCDDWKKKDDRIKVIHKENGGLSDARNAGLEIATGDIVSFIDSDDWINIYFYETMLSIMDTEHSDIIQCEREILSNSTGELLKSVGTYTTLTVSTEEALSMLIAEDRFRQVVWNKLYKREVLVEKFLKDAINEDEFWTYKIFGEAALVTYIDAVMYYYFAREGSIMGSGYSVKRLDGLRALAERHEYICKNYPQLTNQSNNSVYESCIYHYQMALTYLKEPEKGSTLSYIKNLSNQYFPEIGTVGNLKKKIWTVMSRLSFDMTCRVRNRLGIGL